MIREATLNDMPELLRMSKQFISEAPYTVPYDEQTCIETITDFIETDQDIKMLIVAEKEGGLAGMFAGVLSPIYYNKNFKQAHEFWWWVDEDQRGNETGRELFAAYEAWARFHGAHQINCCTMKTNKSLVGWFEKNGYTNREFFCSKEV